MIKKLIIILIFPLFIFSFLYHLSIKRNSNLENEKILSSEDVNILNNSNNNELSIEYNQEKFTISWLKIENIDNLYLIENFSDWKTSEEVIKSQECKFLVNSGFYDTDRNPIGLFISDGIKLSEKVNSNLFNGFLTINDFGTPRITNVLPEDFLKIAVQTGPILKNNGKPLSLSINNDKYSRRTVAATTGFNELIFLVIYKNESVYSGPKLEDLPKILLKFEENSQISLADAINLDGGKASCFISTFISLSEISPVGSFFCAK